MPHEEDRRARNRSDGLEHRMALREWVGAIAHRVNRLFNFHNGIEPEGPSLPVRLDRIERAEVTTQQLLEQILARLGKLELLVERMKGARVAVLLVVNTVVGVLAIALSVYGALKP